MSNRKRKRKKHTQKKYAQIECLKTMRIFHNRNQTVRTRRARSQRKSSNLNKRTRIKNNMEKSFAQNLNEIMSI